MKCPLQFPQSVRSRSCITLQHDVRAKAPSPPLQLEGNNSFRRTSCFVQKAIDYIASFRCYDLFADSEIVIFLPRYASEDVAEAETEEILRARLSEGLN